MTGTETLPEVETQVKRTCRHCGCTDRDGCPEACYWVQPDLCSVCARLVDDLVNLLGDFSGCSRAAENNTRFTEALNGCLREAVAIFAAESLVAPEPLIVAPTPAEIARVADGGGR
jgi:hypothetical protein